mmetsp:Transcript_5415/g.7215  ORF Transcript_5415/g.7215 Transcript_5415/m.7215 type:complete len:180 (+) Transcript_5415:46-585(+)
MTPGLLAASTTSVSALFGMLLSTFLLSLHQRIITSNRQLAQAGQGNRRPSGKVNIPPVLQAKDFTPFARRSRKSLTNRASIGDIGHYSNEIATIADLFNPPTNAKEEGLGTVTTLIGFGGLSFLTFIGVTFAELMRKPPPLKSSFPTEEGGADDGFSENNRSKRRRSKKNKSSSRSKKK